ncbi:hypothetical protein [Nocardioides sp. AX2bis]|uniref:hypothetical protein n=1 Tax=Nocardioides sp. AX2bis TaxID=2653157 RepID=UPI0012F132C4|nr:hypothetical protein [Nocardioides sp. AX2bis]VXB96597.1 conserved exported hypothetical protein [Nocardioides sp. AX2bis]
MRRPGAGVLVAAGLVLAATAPSATTRAGWNDTARVSSQATTLTVAPVLSCTEVGSEAVVSWPRPVTGTTYATVAYTATIARNGGGPVSAPVADSGSSLSVTVPNSVAVLSSDVFVSVTGTLSGTSWTGSTPITLRMRGLLAGWRVACT